MRRSFVLLLSILIVGGGGGIFLLNQSFERQTRQLQRDAEGRLPPPFASLEPLHTRLKTPEPGDWVAKHFELGQTYEDYVRSRPPKLDSNRRIAYLQPLGELTDRQRQILARVAVYVEAWFGFPARIPEGLPLSLVPESARRLREDDVAPQILTTYVIRKVLRPRIPDDAACYLALTASDLWPGEGWNRVYGEASYQDRVGVWSLHCFGDPDESPEAMKLCLLRAIKTTVHEMGHTLLMEHCVLYECIMCGSNHLEEMDRHPLALCPHCLAKLCFATGVDPERHIEQILSLCRADSFPKEQEFYEKSLAAMRAK